MGALHDLMDRLDTDRNALMSRLGGAGQAAPDLTLPGLLEILALGQRTRPSHPLPVQVLNRENIHAMVNALGGRQGIPISAAEVREVVTLLTTGELFEDLETGLAAAVRLAPQVPAALVEDALALTELPADLAAAIRRDLHDDPSRSPREVLVSLRDGRLDREVLTNTLHVLLGSAAPQAVVTTVRTLIAPENRTVRLAVVVYARLHGVDIDGEDLDAVYRAIDPANPDLSPLFAQGLTRVREQFGRAEDALALLRRLSATR
ncbi:MAG: hypothetical protein ACREKS_17270 [Candidatus Rokuibacteriota bacterium]